MSKFYDDTGAWPTTARDKRRMTRREVEELRAACPSSFDGTVQAASGFLAEASIWADAAAQATDPVWRSMLSDLAKAHANGDQVGAFKAMTRMEHLLFGDPDEVIRDE